MAGWTGKQIWGRGSQAIFGMHCERRAALRAAMRLIRCRSASLLALRKGASKLADLRGSSSPDPSTSSGHAQGRVALPPDADGSAFPYPRTNLVKPSRNSRRCFLAGSSIRTPLASKAVRARETINRPPLHCRVPRVLRTGSHAFWLRMVP